MQREKIRSNLASLNSSEKAFQGTNGHMYFDANRSAVRSVQMGSYAGGRFLSAPVQLNLVRSPARTPDFDARLREGDIVSMGADYLSRVQVVYVGLDPMALSDIDQKANLFTADLFIWFRYSGQLRLDDLEFVNAAGPVGFGEPIWIRRHGDVTIATYRVKGRFRALFDYRAYPFDRQSLPITLRHRTKSVASLVLAVDSLGLTPKEGDYGASGLARITPSFEKTQWRPFEVLLYQDQLRADSTLGEPGLALTDTALEFSRINAVVGIARDSSVFLLKNLLPLFLLTLIIYSTLYFPDSVLKERLTVPVAAVLSAAVLLSSINNQLGDIGYTVPIEYVFYLFFFLCLLCMLAALAEEHLRLAGHKTAARTTRTAARVIFPALLLAVIGFFASQFVGRF
jgi:branched-chain amino acid transport system substrate-binding protein